MGGFVFWCTFGQSLRESQPSFVQPIISLPGDQENQQRSPGGQAQILSEVCKIQCVMLGLGGSKIGYLLYKSPP